MAGLTKEQLQAMKLDKHDERPNLIAAIVVSISLAYAAVIMRFVARWKARAGLRGDDWFIIAGLATTTGFIIASGFMIHYGLGRNVVWVIEASEMESFVKSVTTAQVLYSISIIPVKLSILCLYHRLFPSRKLYKGSLATATLIISYALAQALCFILQCIPLSTLWTGIPGKCINLNAMLTTMSVLNVSTDFLLVALPIPFLWGLRIDRSRKTQLIGTFLLGATVCIFGILRSIFVGTADPSNPSRSYSQGVMWSVLEICVGIVSACLPTLRPLFTARALKTPTGSHSYGMHSATREHHRGAIAMASRGKPGAAFKGEGGRPFVKLDDVESAAEGGESGEIAELGVEARAESRLGGRAESRGRWREGKGRRGEESRSRSRGIVVTTDIRVHEGTEEMRTVG